MLVPSNESLLTVDEMYRADSLAVERGVPSLELMENAGRAVVREIVRRWSPRPCIVLCGPGNNGGDGFVIARILKGSGWPVRVALLGDRDALKGDAQANAERWQGEIENLSPNVLAGAELVVDAVFGAGLARDITGAVADTIAQIGERRVVAVDIPSGVHGDTGEILGQAVSADLTVTFFRRKPGHLLMPGGSRCGETVVADIGIPGVVLDDIRPGQAANSLDLWMDTFPWPWAASHKYSRGHAVITGGRHMTGAARLAARAAQRVGAGLVTVAAPADAFVVYKITVTSPLVRSIRDTASYRELIEEDRVSSILVGPGNELIGTTRERALAALRTGKPIVLDADGISIFEESPALLFESVSGPCVMTPHEGEFRRVFSFGGGKLERSRAAAAQSGAVILLKGADTVIAAPDGRAVINTNATPDLATGGSGDVLAGLVTGLLAQGMPAFEAAAAAAWLHGAAGSAFGPGLVAEDIIDMLPAVLRKIKHNKGNSPDE